jgi:hypothetical protein
VQVKANNQLSLNVSNAGVPASVSSGVTLGIPQLFEIVQGANSAALYRNGTLLTQGSVPNCTATLLNGKISNSLIGQYFEILLYNRNVSDFERQAIEAYLLNRYRLPATPVGAPTYSAANNTTFDQPSQVAISGPPGAIIYFTDDGSTPVVGGGTTQAYSGPLLIKYSTTLKSIAVIDETKSSVATANYLLDPIQWAPPSAGGTSPPVINQQLPTTAQ